MNTFDGLYKAVQLNCDISDSRYAQNYSLCVYLLKMREMFRWEQGVPLHAALSKEDVGVWLARREQRWEDLEEREFECLPLDGECFDPFASEALNRRLLPHHLVYSGGYGRFSKPLFFIGKLLRHTHHEGVDIYLSEQEYARELAAPPAMSQGSQIFIRRDSVRRALWEQLEEWQWRGSVSPFAGLLTDKASEEQTASALEDLTDIQVETMLAHEIGEIEAGRLLGEEWEHLLFSMAGAKAELVLRAVRDNLADCLSTLPHLLKQPRREALLLYQIGFKAMRKSLFPSLGKALEENDRDSLTALSVQGRAYWLELARACLDTYRRGEPEAAAAWIARQADTVRL